MSQGDNSMETLLILHEDKGQQVKTQASSE